MDRISISMPNVHYFAVDFSKFTRIPGLKDSAAGEVQVLIKEISWYLCDTLQYFTVHVVKPNWSLGPKHYQKMTLERDWMFKLSLFGVRILLKSMIYLEIKHTEHVFFSSGVRPSWQTKRPDQEHPWKSWFEIKSLILPGYAQGKHHLRKKGFCKN